MLCTAENSPCPSSIDDLPTVSPPPFAERFTGDLAAAARVALRLGWVCRAVNGHVPGDDERTITRLRMFLDGRPQP